MPCCLVIALALLFPRVALAATWILDPPFILTPYNGWLLPVIGFLLLPMTTLAYAWAVTFEGGAGSLSGIIVIAAAVLYDFASYGGGEAGRRQPAS
ncbi:MAG: hypothetical protein QF733_01195 [Phycisphaerales bacterium]|jgi:hypothetical protein|nr:hypothetical protein [Phycisphaerales bacterium]